MSTVARLRAAGVVPVIPGDVVPVLKRKTGTGDDVMKGWTVLGGDDIAAALSRQLAHQHRAQAMMRVVPPNVSPSAAADPPVGPGDMPQMYPPKRVHIIHVTGVPGLLTALPSNPSAELVKVVAVSRACTSSRSGSRKPPRIVAACPTMEHLEDQSIPPSGSTTEASAKASTVHHIAGGSSKTLAYCPRGAVLNPIPGSACQWWLLASAIDESMSMSMGRSDEPMQLHAPSPDPSISTDEGVVSSSDACITSRGICRTTAGVPDSPSIVDVTGGIRAKVTSIVDSIRWDHDVLTTATIVDVAGCDAVLTVAMAGDLPKGSDDWNLWAKLPGTHFLPN